MYLPCATAPDAEAEYEDNCWVIRAPDGRYLCRGDEMLVPVSPEMELTTLPERVDDFSRAGDSE